VRAAEGDQGAWSALVAEFGDVVWATVRTHRLSAADTADAVQCTWLRLVEHLDRIENPARVGPWLATTARRECLAVIRRAGRVVPLGDELPEVPSDAPPPGHRLIDEERASAVHDALAELRPRDRALLRMLAADPAPSYEEIGAALGMPIGSIGPTRARALERLAGELQRAGQWATICA
jgi:RNA polymerase sigma factor (sigma-70 family)